MLIANYPSKKELAASIGKPLRYQETSVFGPEYKEDGSFCVCNRPHITGQKREFFAQVTMENGVIKAVK